MANTSKEKQLASIRNARSEIRSKAAHLDAVARARSEFVLARSTLEHELRQELEARLAALQMQLDITVRYAYDAGVPKAQILSAMGAKYYGMVNESLKRTEGVEEVKGVDPLDAVYAYDHEQSILSVQYVKHGPGEISGEARFDFRVFDDGSKMFLSKDPMYSEDYTIRNDVVAVLDQKQDGFYYDEAVEWIERQLQTDS